MYQRAPTQEDLADGFGTARLNFGEELSDAESRVAKVAAILSESTP